MNIQQIRNATIKITYEPYTFLIDPWLIEKNTGFSARTVIPEMAGIKSPLCDLPFSIDEVLNGVDFCLITHLHPDHFTPDYLPKDLRMVVQNEDDVNELKTMGFTDVITFENDELTIGNLSVHRVDCIHGDNEDCAKRMGKTSGYVIEADNEPVLYIAGDTVYYDGVEETINAYKPEVIVVNCCGATTPRGRLIMDDKEAAKQLPLRRIQSSLPATWTM